MSRMIQPWSILNQLNRELEQFVGQVAEPQGELKQAQWVPAVDIEETPDAYVIHADVPGVPAKDIEINVENGLLEISGERKLEKEVEERGVRRFERVFGKFYRSFRLPETADVENIKAKTDHGVLTIVVPKKSVAKPRKIAVEEGES
ncbi:heat shock protein Hsp20 [Sulfurivirga caldicuralii]|uniref:Heat shock protein Hsp20 n=1 Tax=Sulfurivirga caldicuralii TaxID=364032 RepID=A0A1N6DH48_9GAMM|nr:Hsp20/alpha crystallin family protein [Sulfurivirga caldicuralii]SIN70131.1 heat shock protein Hsp20 [Sulfurivirga caldicuralii]